jgi:hypothetical protein
MFESVVCRVVFGLFQVRVSFPAQVSRNLGAELAGKAAIFMVTADAVRTRTLPSLDDAFANSVRPGLTYEQLYKEVPPDTHASGGASTALAVGGGPGSAKRGGVVSPSHSTGPTFTTSCDGRTDPCCFFAREICSVTPFSKIKNFPMALL